MKHRLNTILQWKTEKLISKANYDKLQANLIEWYSQRLTGKSTNENDDETEPDSGT